MSPFFMTESIFESSLTTSLVSSMSLVERYKSVEGLFILMKKHKYRMNLFFFIAKNIKQNFVMVKRGHNACTGKIFPGNSEHLACV